MKVINTRDAEHYVWSAACDGWHLMKHPEASVIQERVPAGHAEALHVHERARQFFFILEGEATILAGSESLCLKKHDGVEISPNTPHQFRNDSNADVHFLVISVPPSHDDRKNL